MFFLINIYIYLLSNRRFVLMLLSLLLYSNFLSYFLWAPLELTLLYGFKNVIEIYFFSLSLLYFEDNVFKTNLLSFLLLFFREILLQQNLFKTTSKFDHIVCKISKFIKLICTVYIESCCKICLFLSCTVFSFRVIFCFLNVFKLDNVSLLQWMWQSATNF